MSCAWCGREACGTWAEDRACMHERTGRDAMLIPWCCHGHNTRTSGHRKHSKPLVLAWNDPWVLPWVLPCTQPWDAWVQPTGQPENHRKR